MTETEPIHAAVPTDGPITPTTSHVIVLFPRGTTAPVQIGWSLTDPLQVVTAINTLLNGGALAGLPGPELQMVVDQPWSEKAGAAGYAVLRFRQQGTAHAVLHVGNLPPDLIRAALELIALEARYDLEQMIHQRKEMERANAPKIILPNMMLNGRS